MTTFRIHAWVDVEAKEADVAITEATLCFLSMTNKPKGWALFPGSTNLTAARAKRRKKGV